MTTKIIAEMTRAAGTQVVLKTEISTLRYFSIQIEDRRGVSEAIIDKDEARVLIAALTEYITGANDD